VCGRQVVKLRVVAADCGHPPLSTTLDLSLIVNQSLGRDVDDDYDRDGADDIYTTYGDGGTAAGGGRRRGTDRDPTNVVLVGAACGSGLVMFSGVITAIAFSLRRRQHRRRDDCSCCCCCCCCEAGNRGPSRRSSLRFAIQK